MYTIYLDVCCLNRPFDDQTQERVRLEAEAIVLILRYLGTGEWQWLSSEVVNMEVAHITDAARRQRVLALLGEAHQVLQPDRIIMERARQLQALGFPGADSAHLACAEYGGADLFLTTDDKLLRRATRSAKQLRVRVVNPLIWLRMEVRR